MTPSKTVQRGGPRLRGGPVEALPLAAPLTLIHRNKVPTPVNMRAAGRFDPRLNLTGLALIRGVDGRQKR